MFKTIRTKIEKIKSDYDLENEDVAFYAVSAAVFAGLVGLAVTAVVQETKRANAENEWARTELTEGRQVWRLEDGSLISTDNIRLF